MQGLVRIFSILLMLSFVSVLPVSAQVERSFDFKVTPLFPNPGESVSVFAETYSFDISRAQVVWSVDGKVINEGRGLKTVEFLVGDVGEKTNVSFTATRNGETISHTISITPSVIDLIVEAETYTPPLYKGAALATHKASVRIIATPSFGNGYTSKDFIYTWRINGTVQGSISGAGRDVLNTVAAPFSRRLNIRVDVASIDGKVQGRKSVSIKTERPEVLLYAINPLLGLSTTNILANETELNADEVTINAEPFYVPGIYRESLPITYAWKLNGTRVSSTNDDLGTITLRQAGNGRGRAQISVSIEHPQEVTLQGGDSASFTFGIENTGLFNF
ncbi:hypothetical protein COB87_001025 [Candidatus Wolfebacteria bacterium]|nr:hypothetical protein [Candidatus Wolfebacteria bacterium]